MDPGQRHGLPPTTWLSPLAENAARNGVEFRLSTEAQSIGEDQGGWLVRTSGGTLRPGISSTAPVLMRISSIIWSQGCVPYHSQEGQHLIVDQDLAEIYQDHHLPDARTAANRRPYQGAWA